MLVLSWWIHLTGILIFYVIGEVVKFVMPRRSPNVNRSIGALLWNAKERMGIKILLFSHKASSSSIYVWLSWLIAWTLNRVVQWLAWAAIASTSPTYSKQILVCSHLRVRAYKSKLDLFLTARFHWCVAVW